MTHPSLDERSGHDGTIVLGVDDNTATRVNARWQVNGTEHTGSFTFDRAVKTGDPLTDLGGP